MSDVIAARGLVVEATWDTCSCGVVPMLRAMIAYRFRSFSFCSVLAVAAFAAAQSAAPFAASAEATAAPGAQTQSEKTDHDEVVGRFGVGYFGQLDVPIGFSGLRAAGDALGAQMLGVRYWWSRVRLDVAVGANVDGGTQTVSGAEADGVSTLALAARVALPFALFVGRHYTFFAGPEIAYGAARETIPAPNQFTLATRHDGRRLFAGGRAGAEIQFGFIGIPHLALDATIGLGLDVRAASTEEPVSGGAGQPVTARTAEYDRIGFRTSTAHQPWNIFISNVAAVYYF